MGRTLAVLEFNRRHTNGWLCPAIVDPKASRHQTCLPSLSIGGCTLRPDDPLSGVVQGFYMYTLNRSTFLPW
jgi:hypothetical protein